MSDILLPALLETLYMVLISTALAIVVGFIPAIIMIITYKDGLKPNEAVYKVLDVIVNVLRSFPFIILMIVLIPLTRFIVGKSTGTTAAIVPLTIGCAPFVTRIIESSLKEVDKGVVEAAKSFGASTFQIVFKVMLKEALPSIVSGMTLTLISMVGFSAMAGVIGAGGLGAVAMNYGYYAFKNDVLIVTVIVLIVLVQALQSIGTFIYKRVTK
ncbi:MULTISPECIES: methionine ABC transporter permease [Clostridium]|uniref:ABC transporter permease protein n=1 Tax=Clostridium novyi (strain NT) TaxID=386415 RepID=A0Q237_CLONN|nr:MULTISPECIES: methionine ABC transporter permease [Clostridium]ABK62328.1 ABC transporter permease protein [Clostridium novyi NT]KEH86208.1 methionine ABC transporter permease [Clostridium novyi A str. NCTC 538]KEH87125.1 methionine ABC transporter permease [Clostridium novyi A str. BKT29909]KEH88492.1 methionine ABC transporter permease [Clostridium novyi A str. 4540]KEH90831.1 methionine ABC transporter permease [Clostridium botulinum C/D str. It1]